MREGSDLVRAANQYAHEQPWRSWLNLATTLLALTVLFGGIVLAPSWMIAAPLSFVAGFVMVRLFIIYHDYQHGSIFRNSWLAGGIMWVYGLLTLTPPSIWNRSHNHHHKHNAKMFGADIGSFPMMTTAAYAKASRRERFLYGLARHPLTIGLGYFTVFLYGMTLRPLLADPKEHWDGALSLVAHLGLVAVLAIFAPMLVLWLVVLPMTVAGMLGAYLFYAQHNFPAAKIRNRDGWTHVYAALHSSSYMTMSPLMHWLTGNIGYHHVHHLNSRIPFYRLPEAMRGLVELQTPGTTSLSIGDIRRCLRLKLWSPADNCLVGFPAN